MDDARPVAAETTLPNVAPVTPNGPLIRRLRFEAGMSIRDLAEKASVDHGYLSRVERGLAVPTERWIAALATALNRSAGLARPAAIGGLKGGQQNTPGPSRDRDRGAFLLLPSDVAPSRVRGPRGQGRRGLATARRVCHAAASRRGPGCPSEARG